ncbi:MAG: fibronectin type III domain-containing protein [Syntrophobacteraceae bacterium]
MKRMRHVKTSVWVGVVVCLTVLSCFMAIGSRVLADVPGRPSPAGPDGSGTSVPNPGNQQQELPNITFPAPYNIFEFVVTCMACHGGLIDQSAGHGANWAGSNMASATRDPIFRANQLIVNHSLKRAGAGDGAGNLCFRCHSPNGWLSGRFDPKLGAAADGSDIIQSIVLSTDNEGVQCEQCHRAVGAVTMQRLDLNPADPVWNMLSGLYDWPHAGNPFPQGPTFGNPFGDATLQYHDGMSYGAKYGGNVELSFSDSPLSGFYTGQTYGTYPFWFTGFIQPPPPGMPSTNDLGDVLAWNPDGSLSFVFEAGVTPDALWGAVSPEHSTRENLFVKSPEFCGSCHDVTVPVQDHGMPEQRTYTEWKYSQFSANGTRCQDCHMPTMKHEFTDNALVSFNVDPTVGGWYPYARDRNAYGGTAFHKFAGANRDLPKVMKVLYPEIDLEVIGAPTGHDPVVFPGMLTDRGPMFDRHIRNTHISLRDAVSAQITSGPTETTPGMYQVTVRVTNNAGHKVPSGYPDGRRMWISLVVKDPVQNVVYRSGHYDPATAQLYNDATMAGLTRALSTQIDATTGNKVMIYERKTGTANGDGTFNMSFSLLNEQILFDNRIPPAGFTYADYSVNGAKFMTYTGTESAAVPSEIASRYPEGQNWDEVTYTFNAPPGSVLSARAEVLHQTLPREFMEHLKISLNALEDDPAIGATPRPQGGPNILDPNYPLTPTFLSDSILQTTGEDFFTLTDLAGNPLRDNWAGVAYAAWVLSDRGAPYVMAAADTAVATVPAAPATVTVIQPIDPATGVIDPNAQFISWSPVVGADGYIVWIRYGTDTSTATDPVYPLTASWDRLSVVQAPEASVLNLALNPGKTFQYKVQAFNAAGVGADSEVVVAQTAAGQPLPPTGLRVTGVTASTVSLAWYDEADNETDFVIQRQDVPLDTTQVLPPFVTIATIPSATPGAAFGANVFTDTGLLSGRTYNYQVAAQNGFGLSGWTVPPVAATTTGPPPAPTNLTATVVNAFQVDLSWTDNTINELSFQIERATNAAFTGTIARFAVGANSTTYSDTTAQPATTYYFRVRAHANLQDSNWSTTASVTTPQAPPAAPSGLTATASPLSDQPPTVTLTWTDNATNEQGFAIERANGTGVFVEIARVGANVTTFLNTTVQPKTTYTYRVRAFNIAGFSLYSSQATAITPGEIPEAPSNLAVTRITRDSIRIRWNDNSNNEQGFYVERSLNGVNWTRVRTNARNDFNWNNTGLARRRTYFYRVQAFNADGVTAYTNVVSATTL